MCFQGSLPLFSSVKRSALHMTRVETKEFRAIYKARPARSAPEDHIGESGNERPLSDRGRLRL